MSDATNQNPIRLFIPGSKSMTHRAFLLGAQTMAGCMVRNALISEDTLATLACLQAMGADFERDGRDVHFCRNSNGLNPPMDSLDCRNSGTTLRLMLGQAARLAEPIELTGDASLRKRPNQALLDLLSAAGVQVRSQGGRAPLTVRGPLNNGDFSIGARVSSQFASSALCALAMSSGSSTLKVRRPILSKPYLDMTLEMLHGFGYEVTSTERPDWVEFRVVGDECSVVRDWTVEGDWSTAAFPAVAGILTNQQVEFSGLNPGSVQGDREWVNILSDWGTDFRWIDGLLQMRPGWASGDRHVDLGSSPDLFPALCVLAAFRSGVTTFYGAPQLRHKESDRIAAMASGLRILNVQFEERQDGIIIHGGAPKGGRVQGMGDHRVYMAFSVMGLATSGPVHVDGPRCEAVSYPDFHRDLARFT